MAKGSLKEAFFKNAVTGFIVRHSEKFVSLPFIAGYSLMILKDIQHPGFHTASGLLMVASSVCLGLNKKWPDLGFRLGGALGVGATLCLMAAGFDFENMQIAEPTKFFPPMSGLLIVNTMIGFQKEISRFSQKHENSENRILRAFAKAGKYPLVTGACIDLTNGLWFMQGAVDHTPGGESSIDWGFVAAIGCFGVGEMGLIASDRKFQEAHRRYQSGGANNQAPAAYP